MFDNSKPPKAVNQLKAGVILSYVNMILGNLIPLVYTPWMLSLIGKSEYGLFSTANSIVSYLSLLSLGVGTAVIRYLSKAIGEKDEVQYRTLLGLFLNIFRVIAGVCFIAGTVLTFSVSSIYSNSNSLTPSEISTLTILVFLLTVNITISFLFMPYTSVITSNERYLFLQTANIFQSILPAFLNIAILYIWPSSISLIIISLSLNIIIQLSYKIYCSKVLAIKPLYRKPEKGLIKELFFFTFWVFVASVVNQLYTQTDKLIISYAISTAAVAVYQIAATFSSIIQSVSLSISNVLTPKITKLVSSVCKDGNMKVVDELLIKVGRLQCYVVCLCVSGFAVFGRAFISMWVGEDYKDAYLTAMLLIIPSVVPLLQNVAYSAIVALNRHKFRSLVYLAIAIANVSFTIPAVYKFGIIGAALVTNVCSVIGTNIIMNWYYKKKIHLDILGFWKIILPRLLFAVGFTFVGIFISNYINLENIFVFLIGVIIYTIIYSVLLWMVFFNDYEKDVFRNPINKIIKKFSRKKA